MILSKKPRGEQLMRLIRFGKGQRLSNIPANSLAPRVVPSFDKGGFSWFFSDTPLGFCGEDLLRGLPEIAEGVAVFVVIRNVCKRYTDRGPLATRKVSHFPQASAIL